MATVCNYSHPETLNTSGLVRNGSGTLFPYNPEFYELSSGLYGPGAIYCWQLLLLSVILNWSFYPEDGNGNRRPAVSNDLLGVVAYPAFAATDALVQSIKMLGTKHRALAVFCLRFQAVDLLALHNFTLIEQQEPLDLRNVHPEALSLGQHAINLTGPLNVCYMFAAAGLVRLLIHLYGPFPLRPTRWAEGLVIATFAYVALALIVVHSSLGSPGISIILAIYETMIPILQISFLTVFYISFPLLEGLPQSLVDAVLKGGSTLWLEFLWELGMVLWTSLIFTGTHIYLIWSQDIRFVPDSGTSITDRDQLATLLVGLATLGYTLYGLWCQRTGKGNAQEDQAAMVPLTRDVD